MRLSKEPCQIFMNFEYNQLLAPVLWGQIGVLDILHSCSWQGKREAASFYVEPSYVKHTI